MNVTTSAAARLAMLSTGLQAFMDAGAGRCRIVFYEEALAPGVAPATLPLLTIVLQKPCGTISTVLTLLQDDPEGSLIARNGTPNVARFINGAGAWVMDTDVSDTAGTGAVKLDDINLKAGGRAPLLTATIG